MGSGGNVLRGVGRGDTAGTVPALDADTCPAAGKLPPEGTESGELDCDAFDVADAADVGF